MFVKLSYDDLDFMLKHIGSGRLPAQLASGNLLRVATCYSDARPVVDLTTDEAIDVQDALGDLLMEKGLDNDGNLNDTGYLIESLIDQFSPYQDQVGESLPWG